MEWPYSEMVSHPDKFKVTMAAVYREAKGRKRHVKLRFADGPPLPRAMPTEVTVEIMLIGERRGGELDIFLRKVRTSEVYHYLVREYLGGHLVEPTNYAYLFGS